MILKSLTTLHQRLSSDPANGLAPEHFSLQDITFKIVLLPGDAFEIQDFREKRILNRKGKQLEVHRSRPLILPGDARQSEASFAPCFLWDDTRFVLGWHGKKNDPSRNLKCHKAFVDLHLKLEAQIEDPDFSRVCDFLRNWKPSNATLFPALTSIKNGRMVFQISGKTQLVHDSPRIRTWYLRHRSSKPPSSTVGQCIVTGRQNQPITRLHPGIRNYPGSPYTGASLVSFNDSAYESHGKEGKDHGRGANSPTAESTAKAYTAALDWLLDKSRRQRSFTLGDTTAVFWTSEATQAESGLPWMLAGSKNPEDKETVDRLTRTLAQIMRGTIRADTLSDPRVEYFLLGLSLNQGRLSIRFWLTGSLGNLIENLQLHFKQLELLREWDETNSPKPEPLAPTARDLILQTVPLKDGRRDESRASPLLAGALMQAIITGTRYPESMAQAVMNRIRVIEKNPRGNGTLQSATYLRTAILKAWLLRNHGDWLNQQSITMTTALNTDNPSIAYQLGRLFAVYEQAQRAAHGGKLERTIRESMFSAASATPLAVFVRLDKLNKHHLQKLRQGSNRFFSNLIDEIHQKINGSGPLPPSLDLKGQSLFCIGYYHQRHDLK